MSSTYRCKHLHVDTSPELSRGERRRRADGIYIQMLFFHIDVDACIYMWMKSSICIYCQPPDLTLFESSTCR